MVINVKVKLETAGTTLTPSDALIVKDPVSVTPSVRSAFPFGDKVKTDES